MDLLSWVSLHLNITFKDGRMVILRTTHIKTLKFKIKLHEIIMVTWGIYESSEVFFPVSYIYSKSTILIEHPLHKWQQLVQVISKRFTICSKENTHYHVDFISYNVAYGWNFVCLS